MAKSLLRNKAIKLRKQGESVNIIAKKLEISKSTTSLWVRDVILSVKQLEALRNREIKGRERGSLMGALVQKQARLKRIKTEEDAGAKKLKKLTDKELLVAGIALYAGEGNKKTRVVRFSNSDSRIISFMIRWLKQCFDLTNNDLCCFIGINETHRSREQLVKDYWSKITGLPLSSFRKTSFKKSINKKIYDNFNEHYGTLDVRVLQSARIYYRIMGLIHGLFGKVAQW